MFSSTSSFVVPAKCCSHCSSKKFMWSSSLVRSELENFDRCIAHERGPLAAPSWTCSETPHPLERHRLVRILLIHNWRSLLTTMLGFWSIIVYITRTKHCSMNVCWWFHFEKRTKDVLGRPSRSSNTTLYWALICFVVITTKQSSKM